MADGTASPPRPESVPVLRPFTSQDTIRLASTARTRSRADDTSLIVNVDAMSERTDPDLIVNGTTGDNPVASGGKTSSDPAAAETTNADAPADAAGGATAPAADGGASADTSAAGGSTGDAASATAGDAAAATDAPQPSDAAKTTEAASADAAKKGDGDRLVVGGTLLLVCSRFCRSGVSVPQPVWCFTVCFGSLRRL